MFEKKIVFLAQEDYYNLKEDYPKPIKLNVPDWYKKLTHTHLNRTVKGCMPFLDTLTMGYLLYTPISMTITHNVKNEQGVPDTYIAVGDFFYDYVNIKRMNINTNEPQMHPCSQLEGSPAIEKNKNLPFYKIINPWVIKTPPGYSCLFVPPLNNSDDRFSIIPGIVDTDKVKTHINFPIIINGDKYPTLQTTIEKGTPYVQIIPFKRDDWKMSVNKITTKDIIKNIWSWGLENINMYKNRIWSKKKCK
jgi:hypothetical protein